MLNYGQHPDTPAVAALRVRHPAVNKFVGRWSEQLVKAKQCLQAAQQRQEQWANKHRQLAPEFKPGDQVLLSMKHFKLYEGFKVKLAPPYFGPFRVLECIGPCNLAYRLELPQHLRMHNVFYVSALQPHHSSGQYLDQLKSDKLKQFKTI
jgi:hypothetical protein